MAGRPLRPATDRRLGRPLPHQLPNRTQAALKAHCCFGPQATCGISPSFPGLSPTSRHIPTRYSPVRHSHCWACDLHVLSMPPAFALSQDQTLRFIMPDALQHQAIRSPISSSHSLRQSQPSIYDQPGPRLSTQQVNPPGADHASHPVSKTRQNNKPSQSITRIAKTLHKKNQMHLSKSANISPPPFQPSGRNPWWWLDVPCLAAGHAN